MKACLFDLDGTITDTDVIWIDALADTLAALRHAKSKGIHTFAIVNVIGSSVAREADSVVYTMAGPEIAVASTKAYSVQCSLLSLLAIKMALDKKTDLMA